MKTIHDEDGEVEYYSLRLSEDDPLADETRQNAFSTSHSARRRLTQPRDFKIPFIISSITASALAIICILQWRHTTTSGASFVATDFPDARRSIEYEQRVFTGDIKLDRSTRQVYHDVPKGEKRWFGDPEAYPEIDRNWKDLLGCEFGCLVEVRCTDKHIRRVYQSDRVGSHSILQ
jgi:hypothetical protein